MPFGGDSCKNQWLKLCPSLFDEIFLSHMKAKGLVYWSEESKKVIKPIIGCIEFPLSVHSFLTSAPQPTYFPIFADEQPAELQDGLTSGSKGQHGGQLIKLLFTFATFNVLKHATSPFPRLQWWQTPRPSNWKRKIYQPDTYFEMRCQFWRRTTKIQKTLLSSQVFWLPTNGSLFTLKIKLFMRKPEIWAYISSKLSIHDQWSPWLPHPKVNWRVLQSNLIRFLVWLAKNKKSKFEKQFYHNCLGVQS